MDESKKLKSITEQTGLTPEKFNMAHRTGQIVVPHGPASDNDYIEIDPMTDKPPRRMAGVDPKSVGKKRHVENIGEPASTYTESLSNKADLLPRK